MTKINKPILRSVPRQILGKEYFILKRKLNWTFGNKKWSKQSDCYISDNVVFSHKSLILRPLKDVEMVLQENKRTNLNIAIKQIDKVIINPGETFSIWKNVGRPKASKGYLKGLVLNQGRIETGIGGGLCQLGNLLFWMFAHSALLITERHRHSFDVFPDVNRNVPFGAGATLSYNYVDLQVLNPTNNQFQIKLWMDDKFLCGEILSKDINDTVFKVEERNHVIKQQNWGGYTRHNQIFKIELKPSGEILESVLVENHALMMYSPLLNENNAKCTIE